VAGFKRVEDIVGWQLSVELRDAIVKLTETGAAARDAAFRDQIRRSSRSTPANVAEGFGLFKPRSFAKHVRIARGSLLETRNHVDEGCTRKYFTKEQGDDLKRLATRAIVALSRLLRYLESCKGRAPAGWSQDA
jgi:four helix bundle protein